ncbi:MAG: RNA-binding protein [Sphingobacteriales bacterium]|nr:MAG: RNA-binding protein [Sphingobacteriales bacterium]
MQLYLENLPLRVSEQDIYYLLSEFGSIISIKITRDSHGRSLCSAHVDIKEDVDGRRIITALHNSNFKEHYLIVYEIK